MSYQDYYAQRSTVDEYLAFHYPDGDPLAELLPGAPPPEERLPLAVRRLWRNGRRALDVGAAVGRLTLELAKDHEYAIGLDLSHALIRSARDVQQNGCARYSTQLEGNLRLDHEITVESKDNADFIVGDALALPFRDQTFDTVVALNLVDRVPDPRKVLDELARVSRQGGTLIIASPYTWLEGYTPREQWLGGFVGNRGPVRGIEAVRERLSSAFALEEELRLPFFIPHHARSGQLGVALVQRFERKS